jgi:hypothetical protein
LSTGKGMIQDRGHRHRGHHPDSLIPESPRNVSPLGQQPSGEITSTVGLHNQATGARDSEERAVATQTTSRERQVRFVVRHMADLLFDRTPQPRSLGIP